jgi:hypothetical protein
MAFLDNWLVKGQQRGLYEVEVGPIISSETPLCLVQIQFKFPNTVVLVSREELAWSLQKELECQSYM